MSPTEKTILAGFLFVALVALFVRAICFLSMWRYDKHNPYRRYCKYCGQRQDYYEPGGWTDMGTDHESRHGRRPAP